MKPEVLAVIYGFAAAVITVLFLIIWLWIIEPYLEKKHKDKIHKKHH